MNIKFFVSTLAISGLLMSSASATQIILSGASIYLSDGSTKLANDSHLSIGYFDDAFSDFSGLATRSWADINTADYTELFTSTVNPVGEWSGDITITSISGKTLYVWAFDAIAAPTTVNDQEFGLFTGSDAEWTAEGDSILPPSINNLTIAIVDNAVLGTDLGANISLSAVPEPSTYAALAGLCALGYVTLRRRRA